MNIVCNTERKYKKKFIKRISVISKGNKYIMKLTLNTGDVMKVKYSHSIVQLPSTISKLQHLLHLNISCDKVWMNLELSSLNRLNELQIIELRNVNISAYGKLTLSQLKEICIINYTLRNISTAELLRNFNSYSPDLNVIVIHNGPSQLEPILHNVSDSLSLTKLKKLHTLIITNVYLNAILYPKMIYDLSKLKYINIRSYIETASKINTVDYLHYNSLSSTVPFAIHEYYITSISTNNKYYTYSMNIRGDDSPQY